MMGDKMKYGIQPSEKIDGAYVWGFDDLDDAKAAALKLAEEHRVDVIVLQIIGTAKATTIFEYLHDAP